MSKGALGFDAVTYWNEIDAGRSLILDHQIVNATNLVLLLFLLDLHSPDIGLVLDRRKGYGLVNSKAVWDVGRVMLSDAILMWGMRGMSATGG
jgi:hypothetical protein